MKKIKRQDKNLKGKLSRNVNRQIKDVKYIIRFVRNMANKKNKKQPPRMLPLKNIDYGAGESQHGFKSGS